jgi:hypothetical protein
VVAFEGHLPRCQPVTDPAPFDPSAPLRNPRQEKFAVAVAKGLPIDQAYTLAGYAVKNLRVGSANGSRLLADERVSQRVASLRQVSVAAARAVAVADAQRIQGELEAVAFSDIGDIVEIGADRQPRLRPMADWPAGTRRAIASIKARTQIDGKGEHATVWEITEFKFWPKVEAIRTLREHMGLDGATTYAEVERRLTKQYEVLARALPPELYDAVRSQLQEVWS